MNLTYTAIDKKTGNRISGVAVAESKSVLARRLAAEGRLPLTISEARQKEIMKYARSLNRTRIVKEKEVAVFTRQLAATILAGLLLSDAIETVSHNVENKYFEQVIKNVRENILSGMTLSLALSLYPAIFPQSYISVVKSGEASGKLGETLESLARFLENNVRIKEKIRGAIQYPAFVFLFACLVLIGMVVFIIPRFKEIYAQAQTELPWTTRIILAFSDFVINHFGLMSAGFFIALVMLVALSRLPGIRYWKDILKLKIPIIGKSIIQKSLVSRFCGTMGFLLGCAVPIGKCLEITGDVMAHRLFSNAAHQIKLSIMAGSSFSDAIKNYRFFPIFVPKMILVGEKTGSVAEMLQRTARYYDEEIENTIQNLMVLIEPILISVVGIIVGVIVISLYMPIFKLSTLIR